MTKKISISNLLRISFLLFGLQLSNIAISKGFSPEFDLPGEHGNVTLASFKGKLVYLDFWASWCPPCKKSFPWMNEMQEKYQSQGFEIIAINVDAKIKDAQEFLRTNDVNFTIAFDSKGATPSKFRVKGMPTSYLIDQDGKVIFQHVGFTASDKEVLEKKIQNVLHSPMDK